jgi:cytochrome o ubiquinol oxidase subunit III
MSRQEHEGFPDPHHDTSANTIFGFWVYLMTDAIMFATLFATYAVLRDSVFGGPTARELFSPSYALIETLILLASSFTCGLAMLAVPKGDKTKTVAWYAVTFVLGVCFLSMVGGEFIRLVESGNSWQRNAFLSSYFTLIGTHALHIVFGLLFMIVFLKEVVKRGLIPVTIRRLTCLKLFWFFSYFIWIFMFAIVYLIGAT